MPTEKELQTQVSHLAVIPNVLLAYNCVSLVRPENTSAEMEVIWLLCSCLQTMSRKVRCSRVCFFVSLLAYKFCSAVKPVNAEEGIVVILLLNSCLQKQTRKRMGCWSVIDSYCVCFCLQGIQLGQVYERVSGNAGDLVGGQIPTS